jgi:2-polyprenyl-6-methoxyphenol hydroxylase-like FAD-dependent oxidoreductase
MRRGLVGVGGFIPSSVLTSTGVAPGEMCMVFGSDGFFGYGYNSSSPDEPERHLPHLIAKPGAEAAWWSTYELVSCLDWRNIDREDAKRQLIARHSSWKNATVRKVIESVSIDTVWPTWTIPELPTWERDGMVLVADAAHALQPSSGQGTSQALEDCESFVLLLAHYLKESYLHPSTTQLETETEARVVAAKKFVEMRMPRIKEIQRRSAQIGNMKKKMNVVQEMLLYVIVWIIGK